MTLNPQKMGWWGLKDYRKREEPVLALWTGGGGATSFFMWLIDCCAPLIDISGVDCAYKSFTCDFMNCRHSAAIYIMVDKFRITIWPPSTAALSLHRRAALSSNSNGTRSVYSRKSLKSSLYCDMSMAPLCITVYASLYFLRGEMVWWNFCASKFPNNCFKFRKSFIK
jgi:hypothetical protein